MSVISGTRLGPYEVLAKIGEGGMGEVYRARDTKLNRDVAIKVLPEAFALDADRLARFTREAQVLASLNHPNIAAIYGIEEQGSTRALVMELVEGEDLSARIRRGPIPVDDALPIAKQIAEALEAAHELGVIHRDLKPANIKVRADGTVKVLDFGLAKALDPGAGGREPGAELANSPTITTPAMTRLRQGYGGQATELGVILGTAAYMSPEQARGKAVDRRADIWAFGVVLCEMLTGRRVFEGEDISITLANVLKERVVWERLPAGLPPAIRRLLGRCLERDPRKRLRDIGEARVMLDDPEAIEPGAPAARRAWSWRGLLPWTLTGATILAAIAVVRFDRQPDGSPAAEIRADIVTPDTSFPAAFAISPDGRRIVYAARREDGREQLWVRRVDSTTAQPIGGTENAGGVFWSPDSKSLGMFVRGALQRIDLEGGSAQRLALATGVLRPEATWGSTGVIVFSLGGTMFQVPAGGGEVKPVITGTDGANTGSAPRFLPEGRSFVFRKDGEGAGIWVGSLDATPARLVLPLPGGERAVAEYLPPGWLIWVKDDSLVAQPFDAANATLSGQVVTLAQNLAVGQVTSQSAFSVSAAGAIAYRTIGRQQQQLVWYNRAGVQTGTAGDADDTNTLNPDLSPDGTRIAFSRGVAPARDIWIHDGARASRFTFDGGDENQPLWSPDGTRIAFASERNGKFGIYVKRADGTGQEELLIEGPIQFQPQSWTRDGRFLLYLTGVTPQGRGRGLMMLPVSGDRTPVAFLEQRVGTSTISPDGKWVAYHVRETSGASLYVRPLSGPGGPWQIAMEDKGNASQPRWSADGRELFFMAASAYTDNDNALAKVSVSSPGGSFVAERPELLFPVDSSTSGSRQNYAVTPDGRFLFNVRQARPGTEPIHVLFNWQQRFSGATK